MKATIIIPPYVVRGNVALRPNKAMLPVGPLMIASELRAKGIDVQVVDLVFSGREWRESVAALEKPDVLLLSCHTLRNIESCRRVMKALSWATHVVIGGNAALELGTEEFNRLGLPVDATVRGYGHGLVNQIISKVSGDLKGSASSDLPIPALDLLSTKTHRAYLKASGSRYPILTQGLGCLWSCGYCTAQMNSRWQGRGIERVKKEAKHAKQYGYEQLWSVDNLLVDSAQVKAVDGLCDELDLVWSGMTRPELINRLSEVLGQLKRLRSLAMGVESASTDLLQMVERQQRCLPEEAFQQLAEQASGIDRVAFAVLDWPKGTESDFWELYELLEKCRPSTVSWSFYNPPASEIFNRSLSPKQFGFYRWPLGYSNVAKTRVVQQAMLFTGRWWHDFQPNTRDPFFENQREFGVRFSEVSLSQSRRARSAKGDIDTIWFEEGGDQTETSDSSETADPAARIAELLGSQ